VGLSHFSASASGTLVFRAGEATQRQFVWMDRSGKALGELVEPGDYGDIWASPDGKRLVFDMPEAVGRKVDLWIRDVVRGTTSRFTFDPGDDVVPVWSPDGKSIVFTSNRKGAGDLYQKAASGAGEEQVLLANEEEKYAADWSRDGRHLVYFSQGAETAWDIWALPMQGDKKPFPVVKTRFVELGPSLSPDGRFVAYFSNESGRMEVYVQEFPEPQSKWQVSTNGGNEPFWRADGKEIYYRAPDNSLMAVPVESLDPFTVGAPKALFQARTASATVRAHYRVSPDGQRFLVLTPGDRETIAPTTVLINWPGTLRH
jgi:Tol biopolymer transport system component